MAEYLTKYPKTVSFLDGLKKVVSIDSSSSVEQLHIVAVSYTHLTLPTKRIV